MHRMKVLRLVSVAAALAVLSTGAPLLAGAGDSVGNVNIVLGQKILNHRDWEPIENQYEVGAEITLGETNWPINIATDVFYSERRENDQSEFDLDGFSADFDSDFDLRGYTAEFDLGVREIKQIDNFNYYVGVGFGLLSAKVVAEDSDSKIDDSDTGISAWGNAGIFWRLGSRFNLGFDARYSVANVTLFDEEVHAGGFHYGVTLGWGWPASK